METRRRKRALGGLGGALLVLALLAAQAFGRAVPWGGGCQPPVAGQARTSATCAAQLRDGRALLPAGAPNAVRGAIQAANRIARRPYVWGGGHLSWDARGYDCSGAVSYALRGGDLLDTPLVSGQLAHWGEPGAGRWISVYANAKHVFMVIAGLRFDTRTPPPGVSGPRWHPYMVDAGKFVVRHPAGL